VGFCVVLDIVAFRVIRDLKAAIQAEAKAWGVSLSELTREAVREETKRNTPTAGRAGVFLTTTQAGR